MRSGEMSERWREGRERAGTHCQRVHEDQVMHATLDLVPVQADEIRGKGWKRIPWIGMAMMVSTRLWLGGVVSLRRDRHLADALLSMVKACCQPLAAVVVLTDGWAASPNSIRRAFRENVPGVSGRGCRRWLAWPTGVIGTVIKKTARRRVVEVIRRLTQGDAWAAVALLGTSAGGTPVNTSFIERVHATVRERLASLTRRCRHAARHPCPGSTQACGWSVGRTTSAGPITS